MKKIFSFLTLAAALLCSGTAWAVTEVNTWQGLINACNNSGEYKLTANITGVQDQGTPGVGSGKTVTIDLNGFTIEFAYTIFNLKSGSLTIDDKSEGKKGCIKSTSAQAIKTFNKSSNSTLTVNSGLIESGSSAIQFSHPGTCTINGGVIKGSTNAISVSNASATVTLNGGYYQGAVTKTNGTVTLAGGYFTGDPKNYGTLATGKAIKSCSVTKDEVTYNYTVANNETVVAKIGDKSYDTFDKAYKDVNPGETIVLWENATPNTSLSKYITIDGSTNSKTLSMSSSYTIYNGTFTGAVNACNISGGMFQSTVTAQGTISCGLFYTNPTGTIHSESTKISNSSTHYLVTKTYRIDTNSKLITGGPYTFSVDEFLQGGYSQAISADGTKYFVALAKFVNQNNKIIGGFFSQDVPPSEVVASGYSSVNVGNSKYMVGYGAAAISNKITQGIFMFNPNDSVADCVDSRCEVKENYPNVGDYTIALKDEYKVAEIAETGVIYPSLKDAIAAVANNQTVRLLKNTKEQIYTSFNKDITFTINLNGKTVEGKDDATGPTLYLYAADMNRQVNVTITDGSAVQDGKIISNKDDYPAISVSTNNTGQKCNLIIEGGTIQGSEYAIYAEGYSTTYKSTVTVNGGTIIGKLNYRLDGAANVEFIFNGGYYSVDISKQENPEIPNSSIALPENKGFVMDSEKGLYKIDYKLYAISKQDPTNGTLTLDGVDKDGYAYEGTEITVIPTANRNYKIAKVYTLDEDEKEDIIPYNKTYNGYFFTATKDVTVYAIFDPVTRNVQNITKGDGEYYYETLDDAIDSVGYNETLKLLTDFNYEKTLKFPPLEKTFVIDMNGHTISGGSTTYSEAGYIFQRLNGNITLKNGTFNSSIGYAIGTDGYNLEGISNITLKDMTLIGGGITCSSTNLVLDNVVIKDLTSYGSVWAQANSIMTIKSGTYGSKNNGSIMNGSGCTLNIEGGSFDKDGSNKCIINNGTAHISGGKFAVEPNSAWITSGYQSEQIGSTGIYRVYKESGSRTLSSSNIGTICLPYGVEAGNYEGATFYQIAYQKNDKVYFDEVEYLEAGKAYVFEPTADKISYKMSGKEADSPIAVNGLYGTFTAINSSMSASDNTLTGKYLVNSNKIRCCGDGCSLAANRAYIVWDEIPTDEPAQAPGRRRISLSTNDVNTPTGLFNVNHNVNANGKFIVNGQLVIIRDGKMFNAQGARL